MTWAFPLKLLPKHLNNLPITQTGRVRLGKDRGCDHTVCLMDISNSASPKPNPGPPPRPSPREVFLAEVRPRTLGVFTTLLFLSHPTSNPSGIYGSSFTPDPESAHFSPPPVCPGSEPPSSPTWTSFTAPHWSVSLSLSLSSPSLFPAPSEHKAKSCEGLPGPP